MSKATRKATRLRKEVSRLRAAESLLKSTNAELAKIDSVIEGMTNQLFAAKQAPTDTLAKWLQESGILSIQRNAPPDDNQIRLGFQFEIDREKLIEAAQQKNHFHGRGIIDWGPITEDIIRKIASGIRHALVRFYDREFRVK